ncbi:hypothetical protein BOTBODRAFT_39718 [Botryobasidium botryosum FD-172 SS1]|uniref:Uncharacterized protein n=1 Tax=Botryobasidium botryosum (strain FD-172 SS1) TaxID=930990 RepID=A0A067LVE8_BOTB1|nr:hypothetical protein BOTBODRAFT_39718 [Botryobasidium botryosum FD-172 SS1]
MESLPPPFRAKLEELKHTFDPTLGESIADALGGPMGQVINNPQGGQTADFLRGHLVSYDHTGRFPISAVYGPIYHCWQMLGGIGGGLGRPLCDQQDLPDGGRCAIFEGGHIHKYGGKAELFLREQCTAKHQPQAPPTPFGAPGKMPYHFHLYWQSLCGRRDPASGKIIAEIICGAMNAPSENPQGGLTQSFLRGALVSLDSRPGAPNSAPIVLYGPVFSLWERIGGVGSGLGRPLTDEQDSGDSGVCVQFEGGHVHKYGDLVKFFPPDQCRAAFKPRPPLQTWTKMPVNFQQKWSWLALQNDPSGESIVECLKGPGDLHTYKRGGIYFSFFRGRLSTIDPNPNSSIPPVVVYGLIHSVWEREGGADGKFGRPLTDEQDLPDGGRCSIFEGGHIHKYQDQAQQFPEDQCPHRAPYIPPQPSSPPQFQPPMMQYQPSPYPTPYGHIQQQPYPHPSPQIQPMPQTQLPHPGGPPRGGCAKVIFYLTGINVERDECVCCKVDIRYH